MPATTLHPEQDEALQWAAHRLAYESWLLALATKESTAPFGTAERRATRHAA